MSSPLAKAHSTKPMLKTARQNRKTYHSKCGDDDIGRNIPNTYGVFLLITRHRTTPMTIFMTTAGTIWE